MGTSKRLVGKQRKGLTWSLEMEWFKIYRRLFPNGCLSWYIPYHILAFTLTEQVGIKKLGKPFTRWLHIAGFSLLTWTTLSRFFWYCMWAKKDCIIKLPEISILQRIANAILYQVTTKMPGVHVYSHIRTIHAMAAIECYN